MKPPRKSTQKEGNDSLSFPYLPTLRRGCFFPDGTPLSTPMIPSCHSLLMETGMERDRRPGRGSEDRRGLRREYGWGFPALWARRGEFRRSPRPDGINNVRG